MTLRPKKKVPNRPIKTEIIFYLKKNIFWVISSFPRENFFQMKNHRTAEPEVKKKTKKKNSGDVSQFSFFVFHFFFFLFFSFHIRSKNKTKRQKEKKQTSKRSEFLSFPFTGTSGCVSQWKTEEFDRRGGGQENEKGKVWINCGRNKIKITRFKSK